MKLTFTKKELLNIPNILCYIRLLCVPAFALAFFLTDRSGAHINAYSYMYIALSIFAFASLTDVFDGKIARRFHMESAVGAALDPLADKLLQLMAVICLCVNGNVFWLFPVLIGIRELYQIFFASLLANRNIVGKANYWGKSAAMAVAIGIIFATLGGTYKPLFQDGLQQVGIIGSWVIGDANILESISRMESATNAGTAFYWIGFAFLVVGTVLGYIAASSYTYMVVKQIGGKKHFKDAQNIRINFFDNTSEQVAGREGEQDATAGQEAEGAAETEDNPADGDDSTQD